MPKQEPEVVSVGGNPQELGKVPQVKKQLKDVTYTVQQTINEQMDDVQSSQLTEGFLDMERGRRLADQLADQSTVFKNGTSSRNSGSVFRMPPGTLRTALYAVVVTGVLGTVGTGAVLYFALNLSAIAVLLHPAIIVLSACVLLSAGTLVALEYNAPKPPTPSYVRRLSEQDFKSLESQPQSQSQPQPQSKSPSPSSSLRPSSKQETTAPTLATEQKIHEQPKEEVPSHSEVTSNNV